MAAVARAAAVFFAEAQMGRAIYRIHPEGEEWAVDHDSDHVKYSTKAAAFEAVVAAAQTAIREAQDVQIFVNDAPNVIKNEPA
jgi:predicted transcriptional regulator